MRTARTERPPSPAPGTARTGLVVRPAGRLGALRWNRPAWLAVLLIAAWAVALGRHLAVGTDDLALVGIFSTDEELSGRIVRQMLAARTLSPSHFFAYGALYHELAVLAAAPLSWFRPEEQATLLGLRTVALLGGTATIALTYALGARLYGAWAGLLSTVLVALSAELADWSITAHPDTVQLACIAAGLLVTCSVLERPARGRIALAAAFAGLAFATKYGGVLLLPLVLLAATEGRRRSQVSKDAPMRAAAGDLVVAGAVFA